MSEFFELIQQWGPYIALPLIVAAITQGLKKTVPFFSTILGLRLIHFLPLLLGIAGGLLLPEEGWKTQILVGGGLGAISVFIYKIVTVSLAKKVKLEEKIYLKTLDVSEVKANKFLAEKINKDQE